MTFEKRAQWECIGYIRENSISCIPVFIKKYIIDIPYITVANHRWITKISTQTRIVNEPELKSFLKITVIVNPDDSRFKSLVKASFRFPNGIPLLISR